jgi:hypothetical protein
VCVIERTWHILNLGAGVQSTTLYLMAMQGAFPVDYAIFADTGDEPRAVYDHLAWLQSLNGPTILVRSKGRLSNDLKRGVNSTGGRFASIPAYTKLPGAEEEGRTRRQCSKEYKVEVIERTTRREVCGLLPGRRIPKTVEIVQYVGISLDEAGRFERMKRNRKLGTMRAPLIERFMTREACKIWLSEFGNVPHEVPRSACVFCPFHDDEEWLRVKSVPEDWAHAVEVDEALRIKGNVVNRNMDAEMFVHRSCQPLVQIDFQPKTKDDRQASLPFWRECMGVCGV